MATEKSDGRMDVGPGASSTDSGRTVPTGGEQHAVAGPIAAMIGAIAGAVGGGWSGMATAAPTHYTADHDREYREHYEADPDRLADRSYDTIRPAYQLGHVAARNPDYADREFDAIEADLLRGWTDDVSTRHGDWQTARRYVREAFVRERARHGQGHAHVALNMGGTDTHQRPSFSDPIPAGDPNRVAGDRPIPGREADGSV